MEPTIFTGRIGDPRLGDYPELRKVLICRGRPKQRLSYQPESLELLAPQAWILHNYRNERQSFRGHYRGQLKAAGIRRITEALAHTSMRHGSDMTGPEPLVLLCYEDLSRPGAWCHRRIFAEWYEEQTGMSIPEWWPEGETGTQLSMI